MLVRYKKQKGHKNGSRRVKINILNHSVRKGEADVITTLDVDVRHTKWQKMILPTSIIQDVLDSADKVLRLRIKCDRCGNDINPVLVKKGSRGKRLRVPLSHLVTKRKRSREARRKRKGKRATIPGLQVRHGAVSGSDQLSPAQVVDIRDRIKSKKKVNKRRPFLVIKTKAEDRDVKIRKRSLRCDIQEKGKCCKKSLYINFKDIGWDNWIIAPEGFEANYCSGSCNNIDNPSELSSLHSTILNTLVNSMQSANLEMAHQAVDFCCSPKKFAPLSLLYFDKYLNIVKTNIPDMIVEECSCS